MRIDILTILPEMVRGALSHSVIGRAVSAGIADVRVVDIRDFAEDRHRTTDDTPCGGGGGMIMKPEPIAGALDRIAAEHAPERIVMTDPQGELFSQSMAREMAAETHIAIVCGRYEGVDERVKQHLVTQMVSIGDYVVTGGELPALVILDAVVRLLPGALGNEGSTDQESFSYGLLDYPQYTRPRSFRGWDVPDVLLNGNHADICDWRRTQQLVRTRERRPDLWARFVPTEDDMRLLRGYGTPTP
ncbi:MAG: tRNA (guanosine(37)-N1)-methyltransferase TrmD [Armatimonadetes bacterium]|nr:tRNA (guanosine(37)-N1)-methyltransferase TrmD [Armatimonadota bacterium]